MRLKALNDEVWLCPAAGVISDTIPVQLRGLYQLCDGGTIGDTDLFGMTPGVTPTIAQMAGVYRGENAQDVCFAASSAGDLYLVRPEGSVYRFVVDEGAADREWQDPAAWLLDMVNDLRRRVIQGEAKPLPVKAGR